MISTPVECRISLLLFPLLVACSAGQTSGTASLEIVEDAVLEDSEIPSNPERNAYFGDLHLHTKYSVDAYMFGTRTSPDDAYRFARGESIMHPGGYEIRLSGPPLDFLAVTDHAEYLGIMPAMNDPDSELSRLPISQRLFTAKTREQMLAAYREISTSLVSGIPIDSIDDRVVENAAWIDTISAAENHYQPGILTTFAAFEYSANEDRDKDPATPDAATLHRNVIFRGNAPERPFSALDSTDPEDLWNWMDELRMAGLDVLAIPHNSNISDGLAFTRLSGMDMDKAYADQRTRNEPLIEITQVKGTSETHPLLSPNDEWADFELYEYLIPSQVKGNVEGSYVRQALRNGLRYADEDGFNPFRFGFVGGSDSHVAGGSFDEKGYWSKLGRNDAFPEQRGSVPPGGAKSWEGAVLDLRAKNWFSRWSASGLTGVWAESNTRDAIFDALSRRETFATTGPRIRIRFFAGNDYPDALAERPDLVSTAYRQGVAMGGTLGSKSVSPTFIAWSVKDPLGAPLERLQIVKGWSVDGETHEAVFDVACAQGGTPDPASHRCPRDESGVSLSDCSVPAEAGASELKVSWRDPDFDPAQQAFYYVRVLEVPTCRWSTWDALAAGVPPNPDLPATLQERAWSSPIWMAPIDN